MTVMFVVAVVAVTPAEQAGNPLLAAARRGPDRQRAASRRQHGRQGSALRHQRLEPVRGRHHRRLVRRGQRHARLVHAAGRPGAAGADAAGRSGVRRRRLRPVRHAGLRHPGGVHRRPDDRPHAGIPGQEDRGLRDEDDARSRSWSRRSLVLAGTAVAVLADAGKAGIANPGAHGFSEILYAFTSAANNNGSAFAGLSANTPFYNTLLAHRDVVRPLRRDRAGAGDRRLAGRARSACAVDGRHHADARPAVRRAADRHGAAGGRAELRAGAGARARRRAPDAVGELTESIDHDHDNKSLSLFDPALLRPAIVDCLRQAEPARAVAQPGDVRRLRRQHPDHAAVACRRCSGQGEAPAGFILAIAALAVVHRAVRQLRRSAGRRPQQGAGGLAARPEARTTWAKKLDAQPCHGATWLPEQADEPAQGRRRAGGGRRRDPARRRSDRRRGLGRRKRHHRRIGAGDPRIGRRLLGRHRRHPRAVGLARGAHHGQSRRDLPRPHDRAWSRAPSARRRPTKSR